MRKASKFLTLLLAVLLVAAMAVPALAVSAQTGKVTIEQAVPGETFKLYRVFDYNDTTGEYELNDAYKSCFTKDKLTGAGFTVAGAEPTMAEIMAYVNGVDKLTLAADLYNVAKTRTAEYTSTPVAADGDRVEIDSVVFGFYLMEPVLKDGQLQDGDQIVFSLKPVVGDTAPVAVTIRNKLSVPTPNKFVKDDDEAYADNTGTPVYKAADDAEYDRKGNVIAIGENFEHTIFSKVPAMDAYETYKLEIHDTMHNMEYVSGLALTIGGKSITLSTDDTAPVYYVVGTYSAGSGDNTGGGSQTLDVYIKDLKALAAEKGFGVNAEIKLTYTARLTDDAVIGSTGNINEVYFNYSNDPSSSGAGDPANGESPKSKTRTFTLKIEVKKTDSSGAALTGSTWKLEKSDGSSWSTVEEIDGATLSTFDWSGLDVGAYRLSETDAPDVYVKMEGYITFTIAATTTLENDGDETYSLTTYSASITDAPAGYAVGDGSVKGIYTVTVKNFLEGELPETGGVGLWVVVGFAAVAACGLGVTLFIKRKYSAD